MNIEFVLRFIGGILAGTSAFQILAQVIDVQRGTAVELWPVYTICSAAFGLAYLTTPYVTSRPFFLLRYRIYHASAPEVLAAGIGLAFGLLVGGLAAFPLSFLPGYFGRVLPLIASAVFGYFGVATLLVHKQELLATLRVGGSKPEGGDRGDRRILLLDSSAIIDGRIADVARTGFMGGALVVPRFVLEEIQHIADSGDAMRRNKGRRGVEVLARLQKEPSSPVEISDVDPENAVGVDAKLVRLARMVSGAIVTTDYALNNVAQLQGVEVLNVNVLAHAVRSAVLPGEELSILISQEGKEAGQGVGYQEDGTMIVVEGGRQFLNKSVEIVVTRVLQTAAGRMIFGRPK